METKPKLVSFKLKSKPKVLRLIPNEFRCFYAGVYIAVWTIEVLSVSNPNGWTSGNKCSCRYRSLSSSSWIYLYESRVGC
ncbi:hypothetical protein V1477_006945 [Vespula maculifrons]|uniref:Uncharacterized protein n=1 Tax=Vespula maculifrons TaxID=7453 RepID=A0ABD2CH40_VESMC